jgi:hypothetical protein
MPFQAEDPDRLEHSQRTDGVGIGGVFGVSNETAT